MKKVFYLFVAFLSVCPLQAQRFNKISRAGITLHLHTPDSIRTSDLEHKRLTLYEGFNGDYAVVAFFHANDKYCNDKSSRFPDGNFFSVNAYKRGSLSPVESVEDTIFPDDGFIALCKKYGISDFDFFKRDMNNKFWTIYWEHVPINKKTDFLYSF